MQEYKTIRILKEDYEKIKKWSKLRNMTIGEIINLWVRRDEK